MNLRVMKWVKLKSNSPAPNVEVGCWDAGGVGEVGSGVRNAKSLYRSMKGYFPMTSSVWPSNYSGCGGSSGMATSYEPEEELYSDLAVRRPAPSSGARWVMVVKDYTTILSMSGDARGDGREISSETGGRSGRPVNFNLSRDIQTDHLRSL